MANPTPDSLRSASGLPLQVIEAAWLGKPRFTYRAAMSIWYFSSSIATSAVNLPGRSPASISRSVLTFHWAILRNIVLFVFSLPSWFVTVDGSCGRTTVVYFHESCFQEYWSADSFCKLLSAFSRGATVVSHRNEQVKTGVKCSPCSGWPEDVGSSLQSSALYAATRHGFLSGFAPLVLGSDESLSHKTADFNYARGSDPDVIDEFQIDPVRALPHWNRGSLCQGSTLMRGRQ